MTVAAPNPTISPLERPVTALYGVGPERAAQLGRLEILTVEDLLLHRPRRHEDRSNLRSIAELQLDQAAITHGKIVALGTKWFRKHTKSIFEIILDDGTARLHCRWWNLPYMERYFAVGDDVLVFGKPLGLKPRTIDHPETEVLEGGEENLVHLNRLTPIYPLTEGLPQRWLRSLIWRTLQAFESQIREPWPELTGRLSSGGKTGDPREVQVVKPTTPDTRRLTHNARHSTPDTRCLTLDTPFPTRARAIRMLHFPDTAQQPELARHRLALDEFIELQRRIQLRRRNFETKAQALPCPGDNRFIKPFLGRLGFKLTDAQTAVLRELRKDMCGQHPMRRLLQGDVGSGKTVVAACCALMALESGFSVALMAPTEILAEQHFLNFSNWFHPLALAVELRTGGRKIEDRGRRAEDNQSLLTNHRSPTSAHASRITHHPTLTIGTHTLIETGFAPDNLGLVIIDEQHKFGVAQREQLVRKGRYPHLLVMTATPIPRTLGLTLYGELDVSIITELPPGRGRLQTFVRAADRLPKVWEFMRSQLKAGRQAYVVYPRVEEDGGPKGLKAVTKEFENLRQALAPFRVGLLHGRLRQQEKESVMVAFRANRVQVLLATSLIEVGVDVPNATLMLIENAEQFGLAQLHQLRGRIGRGAQDSICILVAAAKSQQARQRLRVLEDTNDGFRIAEVDLQLRGPGELLGRQQSGLPKFRFGDLAQDLELIKLARELANQLVEPTLK
ncbi:MAG TPA: ATP-dependent DNA helicase RecG [Candidatus Acidoferrum sp.]|jgi:ATP-dependent DNA helicase RecG|nr:ATP-dependent DNA helicase RecG [Candidatus Acidoferrum sp.]